MTTKTAKVKYTPSVGDVTDEITASYNGSKLISKKFYIAPQIEFIWEPSSLLVNEKQNVGYGIPNTSGGATVTNFKIVDNLGATLINESSCVLTPGSWDTFEYIPVASQLKSGAQFTITYELGGYTFTEKSPVIPVLGATGDYALTIEEGKLIEGDESTVVLSSDNTDIETGKTINFTSTKGLNADGELKEA